MIINELADKLDEIYTGTDYEDIKLAATMLRQQEAELNEAGHMIGVLREEISLLKEEIEALKKELALQKLSDISQEIENEPVAHRFKWEEKMSWQYGDGYDATGAPNDPDYFVYEPLYTHANEDRDSAIYATGYWKGIEYKKQHDELQTLVKSFFEDYLNYEEESDSGRVFCPIHVSCTRVMMIEPLAKLLMRMKELSGVKE